jgi:dTDP-4-amino-4,6-dideoxygalactose transaminase
MFKVRYSYLPQQFADPTEILEELRRFVPTGDFTLGKPVGEFERRFADVIGTRHAIGCGSGTDALKLPLKALDIGHGDEVITTANTFIATVGAINEIGARPVFVDCDDSFCMDVSQVEAAITPRTKAIMPVHFAGLPVDLEPVYALARRRGLRVIEDAAHAMGAACQGRRIGAQGDLVAFSFHPNKNITTIEGGALSFASEAEVERAERLRFHGIRKLPGGGIDVLEHAGKSNLADVSARIGIAQLQKLGAFNARRAALARRYLERLDGASGLRLPVDGPGHAWHLFAPLIDFGAAQLTRARFIEAMHAKGIGVGIHYQALHLFQAFRRLSYREGDFPNAETIGERTVTLPLFTQMQDADVDRVCDALRETIQRAK